MSFLDRVWLSRSLRSSLWSRSTLVELDKLMTGASAAVASRCIARTAGETDCASIDRQLVSYCELQYETQSGSKEKHHPSTLGRIATGRNLPGTGVQFISCRARTKLWKSDHSDDRNDRDSQTRFEEDMRFNLSLGARATPSYARSGSLRKQKYPPARVYFMKREHFELLSFFEFANRSSASRILTVRCSYCRYMAVLRCRQLSDQRPSNIDRSPVREGT